jgi:hypothetical protein
MAAPADTATKGGMAAVEDKGLDEVRDLLRKAAEIQDARELWYMVRDILNLLTMMIVPSAQVVTSESLRRAEATQG